MEVSVIAQEGPEHEVYHQLEFRTFFFVQEKPQT